MTNRKSCGDRREGLIDSDWCSVKTKSRRALDPNIDKRAGKFIGAFKDRDLICAGAPHQSQRIGFARPLAKHFQSSTDQAFVNAARRLVYNLEQIVIALLFDSFVDLVRHFRRRRIATGRISKHECVVELDCFDQRARLPEIIFRLTRKSDNDVSGDGDVLPGLANAPDKIEIFLGGVSAVHCFQDFVRSRLYWQMKVIDQLRQTPVGIDQIFAEPDRVRRSEAKALQTVDCMDRFEQLHKRTLIVDLRKFVAAVEVYDLTKQG